jgi:uncharacterized protein YdaU (DUF1376 family)
VNFYKHHIGDYAAATAHLSLIEDAIYSRMLRRYYLQEGPLPVPVEQVARLVGARGEEETVKAMLLEFFVLADDGWHNKRADEEIAAANAQAEANRRVAQDREARKRERENDSSTNRPRIVHRDTEGSCSLREPSQTPDSRLQTPDKNNTPVVPCGDELAVVSAYHDALPKCQQAHVLNAKRRKRIAAAVKLARQVCREQGWPYDPRDFWRAYFAECATDAWMRGEVPHPKNPNWKQNLDVLLAEDRFAGIMDRAIAAMRVAA